MHFWACIAVVLSWRRCRRRTSRRIDEAVAAEVERTQLADTRRRRLSLPSSHSSTRDCSSAVAAGLVTALTVVRTVAVVVVAVVALLTDLTIP